jgi:hypothetical protein
MKPSGIEPATFRLLAQCLNQYATARPHKGKRALRNPKGGWEDNTNMELQLIESDVVEWIDLAQDWNKWRAVVNTVKDHWAT